MRKRALTVSGRMDLHEDRERNVVTATLGLPGLAKEDVRLAVRDGVLTVSGESAAPREHDERGYAVRERRFGRFSRSIPLPQGIKVCDSSPTSVAELCADVRIAA